ncbi:hypothetical protein B296_00050916 [Ensete ventricosum]|uniref:Uncharacterized protein n=1 Tax=Ensete ventricosum TaxID=4639 RepID=A0A426XJR2_ENSVE|nr:hypothetical protein B296_00050916 [Ensete ventricosum]
MVCTIHVSAWTWLVRPRKASAVTMSGAGFDAGEGNPGSVIILQKRLGVGTAAMASSVGRGWLGSVRCSVPESPNGCSGDMGPPSSAKNVREESGACLVDTFRLCDYGASTVGSGPCALARPRYSRSFYSKCCRSFVPGNLTAFMVDHVVVPFHHARRPCGRLYDHWRPPYLHLTGCPCRVDHVDGPAVRGYDVTARSTFVILIIETLAR